MNGGPIGQVMYNQYNQHNRNMAQYGNEFKAPAGAVSGGIFYYSSPEQVPWTTPLYDPTDGFNGTDLLECEPLPSE